MKPKKSDWIGGTLMIIGFAGLAEWSHTDGRFCTLVLTIGMMAIGALITYAPERENNEDEYRGF